MEFKNREGIFGSNLYYKAQLGEKAREKKQGTCSFYELEKGL